MSSSKIKHDAIFTPHLLSRSSYSPAPPRAEPVHQRDERVWLIVHKAQASWKLFWVSHSNQILTLIFQRLIG